jgi:hypothetical protein
MSYKTLMVDLEDGHVRPTEGETLPKKARAILTLLDSSEVGPAKDCAELARRWRTFSKLDPEEAEAFANDIKAARAEIPPLTWRWD